MADDVAVLDSAFEERLTFETMLSDLSSRFVNLEVDGTHLAADQQIRRNPRRHGAVARDV